MPHEWINEWVLSYDDDMSPDNGTAMRRQWKTDIMEVSNDDL
jgi:hypothetical protein